ncbi:MAG: hypothetical protein F4X19_00830 [Acidobacteria bacterium]|nr:hypothetical protein [Acidobacteriota bacterium]
MTVKRNTSARLTVLILIALGVSVSPHRIPTSTAEIDRALKPKLSDFEAARLEPGDIEQQVRATQAAWRIDTIAGGAVGDNGPAIRARLYYPNDAAVDGFGNLYIADTDNHRIRRVDPSGTISTIAGTGESGYSGDNGPAVRARLYFPRGVAVDADGNLFVADDRNNRVRRVDSSGIITTIAGTGKREFSGDGGPAVAAQLSAPKDVAVDSFGNLYIADSVNFRIRRVDPSGIITTIAGTGKQGFSGDGGPATAARLNLPESVSVDATGNLCIADSLNHRIRQVDPSGMITTIAGTGKRGFSGDGGPAIAAELSLPRGLAEDGNGNLYFSGSERVRKVDPSGIITTIAGSGISGAGGDGGPAIAAELNLPEGVAVDSVGNLYVADVANHRICRVNPLGIINTVAGSRDNGFGGDGGPAVDARLDRPQRLAVDAIGNLYIADLFNNRIRRVDPFGNITTVAGTGKRGFSGDGGPAVEAQLFWPTSVAVDAGGNLYIGDRVNNRIRRVDPFGNITTIAGTGKRGFSGDGGPAIGAQLFDPLGMAVDAAGNLYIADGGNHRIRRVDRLGIITTVAGTGMQGFRGDNGPAVLAQLNGPISVDVDDSGNLFIADNGNVRIRRVDPSGIITTIAGTGARGFGGDGGPAVQARMGSPAALAVDDYGNLFITDGGRVRRVDPSGIITTIAGTGGKGFSGDGGPAVSAQLNQPNGLAADGDGNLFVADSGNHRIRILTLTTPPISIQAPSNLTATAVSSSQVRLTWRENFDNETGFGIQRRREDSDEWVAVGTTAANATTFLDGGLEPATTYHFRVRAISNLGPSTFSNRAMATTPVARPPTVTGFLPRGGSVGTWVTLTGTGFVAASQVSFNGVGALEVEVLSAGSLRAVVPPEAGSGPISVVTPEGTGVSAAEFTVTDAGILSRLFVPIVLKLGGQAGSFYTSELTLANRSNQDVDIGYTYAASIGSGSGTVVDSLGAGRQRIVPDAIDYLTSLGLPIGGRGAGGTLQVDFSGLSSRLEGAVTVRTTTAVPDGQAGLAYVGLNALDLLDGPVWLTGLRQSAADRSNLALQNAGDEDITLRVTVFSGHSVALAGMVFGEKSLEPGEFFQYNSILATAGFEQGYVKVERVSGAAPYFTYAVINDQANSDGSFVFPVREESLMNQWGQILPVIMETEFFDTELTVTNVSAFPKTLDFSFVADAIQTADHTAGFRLTLQSGEQRIFSHIVNRLRQADIAGIGPAGPVIAGAVFATVADRDMSGIVIGARTGSPGGGGQYAVFYNGIPYGSASTASAWIYGLQQNAENRSNLALVNTGEVDFSDSIFSIDIYDGDSGLLASTVSDITLPARRWRQVNRILARYAPGTSQGYVRVRQISGNNPFIAYGVINDGGIPGQRSGDGAYLPSQP